MKVGIVGAGLVGSTAAYALVMRGIGREVVLVDRNTERASAEADDLQHAVPFASQLNVRAGDYSDLVNADAVVVAAGVNQNPGEKRSALLGRNASIFGEVIPSILEYAPRCVLVVATNPVDVMTHVAATIAADAGGAPGRVLGTGTMLDTARFRTLLADHVGVDSKHVHGYVLGEHGDTEVLAWSAVSVGGLQLDDFCHERGIELTPAHRARIDDSVRNAAYRIIAGKGASYYGVGSAIARVIDTVIGDRRSVLTVCAPSADVMGVADVTVSLPRLVGGDGILDTFDPQLSRAECDELRASAQTVRDAIEDAAL